MVPTLKPGQTLGGYEIIAFHGKGGMGEIFRARQLSIGREVALKILSPDLARRNPQFAISFVEEARAAGRLNHPNIVAVHDVGNIRASDRDEYLHYFSMEFVDGENLRQVIDREGICPMDLIEKTMIGMAEALIYAEAMAMIHRDIKPENIMVTSDGRIKLADFGLAQQIDPEAYVADRDEKGRVRVMGTPRYMSPEQARGRPLDGRSDQYSLGATLFHLLTGSPPYRRDSGRATMKAHVSDPVPDPGDLVRVSPPWRTLCMRLMAKNPEDRFASASELRSAIDRAINGQSVRAVSNGRLHGQHGSGEIANSSGSKRSLFVVAGSVIVIGIAALVMSIGGPETAVGNPTQNSNAHQQSGNRIDGNSLHLQRAQEVIDNLSDDLSAALQELQQAIGNPYFQNSPEALHKLNAHEQRLQETIIVEERRNNQRRSELLVDLNRVRTRAQQGMIGEARTLLQQITSLPAEDRALIQGDIRQMRTLINQQAQAIGERIIGNIERSLSSEGVERHLQSARDDGLPEATIARIEEVAQQRLASLHQAAAERAAQQRATNEQRLQTLIQGLESFRSDGSGRGPQTQRFISLAADYRNRFQDEEYQSWCEYAIRLGELAHTMQRHIESYIRSTRPMVITTIGGTKSEATIEAIDGDTLTIAISRSSVRTRKFLGDADMNLPHIIEATRIHHDLDEDMANAYAYLWRAAGDGHYSFNDQDLQRLVFRLSGTTAGPTQAPPAPPPTDTPRTYLTGPVNLADIGEASMQWFAGDSTMSMHASGLQWHCEQSIRLNDLSEDRLPTLSLQHALTPPVRIEMDLRVHPGSVIMVGARRDSSAVRLGLDTRNNRLGGVVTASNGQIRSSPLPVNDPRVRGPLQMVITIAKNGETHFRINGQSYQAPSELFRLTGDGPCNLIFQSLNTNNSSTFTLERLHITTENP